MICTFIIVYFAILTPADRRNLEVNRLRPEMSVTKGESIQLLDMKLEFSTDF
jgi:hypothetical protein